MISQQLSTKPYFLFMFFMVKSPKTNATPNPLYTQNKPISKPDQIAISHSMIRTKDNELRIGQAQNKPIQTHLMVPCRVQDVFGCVFGAIFVYYTDFYPAGVRGMFWSTCLRVFRAEGVFKMMICGV